MTSTPGPMVEASPTGGLAGLFELHQRELHRFLAARCGNASDADDLLQDLWLKLQTQGGGPIANGRAYLFRMANNLVLDRSRAQQRAMRRDRDWLERDAPVNGSHEDMPDPTPTPEQALEQAGEIEQVEAAIRSLPPGAQRALRLCRIDGMGQAEAANVMGISRSGIEKHLSLAMRHLRAYFADCGLLSGAASGKIRPRQEAAAEREPSA